jgi:hypothetical protein
LPVTVDVRIADSSEIEEAIRSRSLLLYPVSHELTSEEGPPPMVWEGSDLGEYLDHAQKAGVRTVYVRMVHLGTDGAALSRSRERRNNDVGLAEIAFDQDGVRHVFVWRAPWAKDVPLPDLPSELRGRPRRPRQPNDSVVSAVSSVLKRQGPKLIASFIRSERRRGGPLPSPDSDWQVRGAFLAYLGKTYHLSGLEPDPDSPGGFAAQLRPFRDGVAERRLSNSVQQLSKEIRKIENTKVKALAPKCALELIQQELGLRALTLDRVSAFLQDRNCRLSDSGMRSLRNQTSAIFKKRTHYESHHRQS